MDLFTLDRNLRKKDVIDEFVSCIWTERYYGDGDVELVVPFSPKIMSELPIDVFLGLEGSDEIMVLQTGEITQDQTVKYSGSSLISWLNNRFLRTGEIHEERVFRIEEQTPGHILWSLVFYMCVSGSPYLDGTFPMGIPVEWAAKLALPGLGLRIYDDSGDVMSMAVPFGKLYDTLKDIATTYQIGIQLVRNTDPNFPVVFRSYKGLDRTRMQTENSIVRFSPSLDSLTDVKEIQSSANAKDVAFAFANLADSDLEVSGYSVTEKAAESEASGFDLKALEVLADDITPEMYDRDNDKLIILLNGRAQNALAENAFLNAIDGQIVTTSQFQYGRDYHLGDIVEMQGVTGIIYIARILEHIHSQDSTGDQRTTHVG